MSKSPRTRESPAAEGNHRANGIGDLEPGEAARAEQVARRLQATLRSLVATLPEHARGASGMARQLSVLRSTCQRVVAVLADSSATPAMLVRLPGAKGLPLLLAGFRQTGADEGDVAAAEAAVEQFDAFIKAVAGSQSRLARRLSRPAPTRQRADSITPGRVAEQARRQLFAAAADVTGRSSDVLISIYAFRIDPTDPGRLERAMATGEIAIVARTDAMPRAVILGNVKPEDRDPTRPPFESLDHTPAHGSTPHALLDDFCTMPLPLVTSRGSAGKLVQTIDHRALPDGHPIDFVVANRTVHPSTLAGSDRSSLEGVWKLVNYPTRHLVFDVYLHQDIERNFRPAIDVQLWGPNLDIHSADRWLTRIPHPPRLVLLGSGLDRAPTDAFPRHADLTRHFFDRLNWRPEEFVGFRCEVAYPVWRGGYFMTFECVNGPRET